MYQNEPVENKVEAIDKAPRPTNVSELKAYLSMLVYYNRFLKNLSILLHPLSSLLQSKVKWTWVVEQEKAFHLRSLSLIPNFLNLSSTSDKVFK
jgi:hypothetical protein